MGGFGGVIRGLGRGEMVCGWGMGGCLGGGGWTGNALGSGVGLLAPVLLSSIPDVRLLSRRREWEVILRVS